MSRFSFLTYLMSILEQPKQIHAILLHQLSFNAEIPSWILCIDKHIHNYALTLRRLYRCIPVERVGLCMVVHQNSSCTRDIQGLVTPQCLLPAHTHMHSTERLDYNINLTNEGPFSDLIGHRK